MFRHSKIYHRFINFRVNILFSLARTRGIVPSSFFVTGIDQIGDHPVGCGGFADVWKGHMRAVREPNFVALKILRPIHKSGGESEVLQQVHND